MNTVIVSILLLLPGLTNKQTDTSQAFECIITATQKSYSIGETPNINVTITNNSGNDVYLIGSLDASEEQWRSPYCFYKIEKQTEGLLPMAGRCGNMNPLRAADFKLVKSGESFNPYGHGFFSSYQIDREDRFQTPGTYTITFYYSTKSTTLQDYLGDGEETNELRALFNQVPHIALQSNTIEIEIKQ